MAYKDNNKFAPEDFASIEVIDEWWSKYTKNNKEKDSDGYTPLGAAVLNSAPLECIAHIMELYTFNKPKTNDKSNPFIDVDNDISKGRSPIGVACLAMNADAVDVLRSNYYEYILKDEDGNQIPKLDHYGDPINADEYIMYTSVPLWNEYTKESYKYNKVNQITKGFGPKFPPQQFPGDLHYKNCDDKNEADRLYAAALPKADILIKLIPKVPEGSIKPNYNDITDDNGNTLILLACVADCHESVVHLRKNCGHFNDISTIDDDDPDQIFIKNNDDLSAFDVALESQDTDLLPLLLDGQVPSHDFIDKLLEVYFHEKANRKINKVLITLVTAEHIYDYYVKADKEDGTEDKYEYGYPGDQDYIKYYIIEYIEKENKTNLFNLLLPKYNDSETCYAVHLTEFFEKKCKRIIAFLYRKSYIPFNISDQTNKLNTLLNFHSSILYAEIVKLLYDSHDVSLQLICDISDNIKRNKCIDKIFTGEYNKHLFIELLKIISNNTNDDILDQYTDILTHLYNNGNNGYFTLNNIAELQDDQSLGKPEKFLFNIIYKLVGNDIAIIESSINSTYDTFKVNYCIYLYTDNKIIINDIISSSCSPEFKCTIINTLYNGENLKLDDIYYIYNHYNDTLSGLHNDLKPLIGYMKYCENDSITSDFFWAYDFSNHISANWHSPSTSYVDIPPITYDILKTIPSTRYKQAKIVDATDSVPQRNPNKFRLGVYNYKPEFEIDSVYNATSNRNAMIVAFGSDINSVNDNITTNIPVQSDNNELYSIESGTYLDRPVKIINWVITNSLYAALNNQLCYSKKSDELPVINSIQFKNDVYSDIIDVSLPALGNKITAVSGTHWNLPSVSCGLYTDSDGIKYNATGWKIGSTNYNFNDEYVFNDSNAVAQLEFEKATVTLTYQKSNYATLDFILPTAAQAQSGDSITLATFSSQYYYNTSGIKFEAKKWTINGEQYNPGSSYHIFDNTIAELKCDIASVTLTYTKPADVTLYNESGSVVSWPAAIPAYSGDSITLTTLSNTYYNADRTKTYTLSCWKIGSTNYNFGDTYILKDDITAALQYIEATITVGIVCSVSSETIIEGVHFTRTFKLSHKPTANVILNINSNVANNRLYIGNSVSSTTNSISLTFTTLNWDSEQIVYFRAKDDSDVNGDITGTVSIQANSTSDNRYNGLTRSFSVTVKDNDSAVVEHIGTPAFESGSFAIKFIEDSDEYQAWEETKNIIKIKDQWDSAYRNGYCVQHIPKSPYWTTSNKVFNYDLLYNDNLDD